MGGGVVEWEEEGERRASIRAVPCWPVALVTRIVWVMVLVGLDWVGSALVEGGGFLGTYVNLS